MISLKFQCSSISFSKHILKFSQTKNPQKNKINRIRLRKTPKNIEFLLRKLRKIWQTFENY